MRNPFWEVSDLFMTWWSRTIGSNASHLISPHIHSKAEVCAGLRELPSVTFATWPLASVHCVAPSLTQRKTLHTRGTNKAFLLCPAALLVCAGWAARIGTAI